MEKIPYIKKDREILADENERLREVNAELVEVLKQCQSRLFVHEGISGLYKLSGHVIARAGGGE